MRIIDLAQRIAEQEVSRIGERVMANLCSDCPPADYPTDKTRCLPCPRRAAIAKAESKD